MRETIVFSNNGIRAVRSALVIVLGILSGVGVACAWDHQYTDRMDSITKSAGNAVAHNKAVQTVDPWPRYVGNNRISIDSQRIAIGHQKYRANKSTAPAANATSGIQLNVSQSNGAAGGDAGATDGK